MAAVSSFIYMLINKLQYNDYKNKLYKQKHRARESLKISNKVILEIIDNLFLC